jgi:hypothetical protein
LLPHNLPSLTGGGTILLADQGTALEAFSSLLLSYSLLPHLKYSEVPSAISSNPVPSQPLLSVSSSAPSPPQLTVASWAGL